VKPASLAELARALGPLGDPEGQELPGRRPAAICLPLHEGARGTEVWAIKRPAGLRHHPREIAFPGGKPDPGDEDLLATAMRETEEELGVDRRRLRPLGRLTAVPTYGSSFTLHPFVAEVDRGTVAEPAADEVAALVVMPLGDFYAGRVPYRAIAFPGRLSPVFDFEAGSMYGASAHVLEELLRVYAEVAGLRMPVPKRATEIPWQ
jgi:8-oxo-dGTP pyrophosphatase MutT (NUDIX family)